MKKIDERITTKIRKNLKISAEIKPYDNLKLKLLDNAIQDYNKAVEDIELNGIVITTNRGATTAQNPAVKIKLDNSKLIIRLLSDLMANDNSDADAMLREWLT